MVKHAAQSGYVALMTVLIVGAIATTTALTLLVTSADGQRSALVTQQSKQARVLAIACGEEALQVMHDNTSYTGTDTLALGQGTCSYTVSSTGVSTRSILVTATVGNISRKLQINATIELLNISITSWQEIS